MRVHDLMSHPVATCQVNDTLSHAARLMWDHDCGAIPVVHEDGKLAGMITDRDICMAAYTRGRPLDEILVDTAMAKPAIWTYPEQKIGELEQLMADRQVRRVPVVDPDDRPIGIVSLNDLAVESAQPDTQMKNGPTKVAHVLAAICRPRSAKRRAA